MARRVWAARHGSRLDFVDPEWAENARRPFDPPLSEAGRRQARELGERLAVETSVAYVVSSPFLRCVETAVLAAEALDLPVRLDNGLSEWMNREWFPAPPEIASVSELTNRFASIDASYRSRGFASYGESGEEALLRSGRTARRLVSELEGDLLVVGHGVSVRGVLEGLLGLVPSASTADIPEMPYCCLVELRLSGDRWRLILPCDTSHLSETGGGDRFH